VSRILDHARLVLSNEADAIRGLIPLLGASFEVVVGAVLDCRGTIVISGVGKSGLIGAKLSATLASTGTPSIFLHPSEAIHGDLGRVRAGDMVFLLSQSGESEEVVRLIQPLKRLQAVTVAMTGKPESTLGRNCDHMLDTGRAPESCPLGLAPTTSTAALLALGDALAMTVLSLRGFQREDFARFHPGGQLGRKLMRVADVMRSGDRFTVVREETPAKSVLAKMNGTPGRPGAACIVHDDGTLAGFFTDGDLARRLEAGVAWLEQPIANVMTRTPTTIAPDVLVAEAMAILGERRFDQIPVVDACRKPVGLLDIQDVVAAKIL